MLCCLADLFRCQITWWVSSLHDPATTIFIPKMTSTVTMDVLVPSEKTGSELNA